MADRPLLTGRAAARLRALLARLVPELATATRSYWLAMARDLTAAELREMARSGVAPSSAARLLSAWVTRALVPEWQRAAAAAAEGVVEGVRELITAEAVGRWIDQRGGWLIREMEAAQHQAVRAIVRYQAAAGADQRTVSVMLRSCLGLDERQATALGSLRDSLIADGLDPDRVRDRLLRAAEMHQRVRSERIARTELAAAHNGVIDDAMTAARADGAFEGRVVRVWSAQPDERTCPTCGPLDGVETAPGQPWPGGHDLPPAHPSCRCVVLYEERA